MIIKSVDQTLPFVTNVQILLKSAELKGMQLRAECIPTFSFLAGFLLPDIFLIPLDCTIREGWSSLGKIKNDPNHWPKSCLWNLKLHLLGRKIVFWVWVVFFFKTHFQMLTSWMLSYQFGLENRRVGKHFFFFFKLGLGEVILSEFIIWKEAGNTENFSFFKRFPGHTAIFDLKSELSNFVKYWNFLSSFPSEINWGGEETKVRKLCLGQGVGHGGEEGSRFAQINHSVRGYMERLKDHPTKISQLSLVPEMPTEVSLFR